MLSDFGQWKRLEGHRWKVEELFEVFNLKCVGEFHIISLYNGMWEDWK